MESISTSTSSPLHRVGARRAAGLAAALRDRPAAWLAITGLWLAATAWMRPLAIPDEGRYVGVAWEMVQRGDWLVPTLDGMPFFHKPPLFYWITAAAMQFFGPTVWAARAAAWVGAMLCAGSLLLFLRRWAERRSALAALVVLATLPLFFGGAQYANMDMLVAGCISAATLAAADAVLACEHERRYRRALALAFGFAALGVLAKGLIGVVLPVGVLVAWAVATRRLRQLPGLLFWAPGVLLFIAVAVPWFVAMQWRYPDFGHYFFVVQHLQRYAAGGFNNPQPFWFYPLVLVVTALPWSPWLLLRWRHRPPAADRQRDLRWLMLAWLFVVTVFFSLPQSKLVGYILPALPPLAFLIADAACAAGARPGRLERATAVLAAGVCAVGVVLAHEHQPKSMRALAERLQSARQRGEPVVFVGQYAYDIAFYARLDEPVWVVDGWQPAEVAQDSWRRELADARSFAAAGAAHRLLRDDELGPALCGVRAAWIVGAWPAAPALPWLAGQPPEARNGATALWHVPRAAGCPAARR